MSRFFSGSHLSHPGAPRPAKDPSTHPQAERKAGRITGRCSSDQKLERRGVPIPIVGVHVQNSPMTHQAPARRAHVPRRRSGRNQTAAEQPEPSRRFGRARMSPSAAYIPASFSRIPASLAARSASGSLFAESFQSVLKNLCGSPGFKPPCGRIRRQPQVLDGTLPIAPLLEMASQFTSADSLNSWTIVYRDASTPVTNWSQTTYGANGARTVTTTAPDNSYTISTYQVRAPCLGYSL